MKTIIVFLLMVNYTTASYFRKEQIVSAEEISYPVKKYNPGLRNLHLESAITVETSEGNTYVITNNKEDGIKITDGIETEWKIENKINLRGYKTIEKIMNDKIVSDINFIKISKNNNVTNYLRSKLEE